MQVKVLSGTWFVAGFVAVGEGLELAGYLTLPSKYAREEQIIQNPHENRDLK